MIATNDAHSVKEFLEKAFGVCGLNWQDYVKVDKRFLRPVDISRLCGDYTKAKEKFGWHPTVKFDKLVEIMVKADLKRWERWQKGESFPWDASSYPSEGKMISRYMQVDR